MTICATPILYFLCVQDGVVLDIRDVEGVYYKDIRIAFTHFKAISLHVVLYRIKATRKNFSCFYFHIQMERTKCMKIRTIQKFPVIWYRKTAFGPQKSILKCFNVIALKLHVSAVIVICIYGYCIHVVHYSYQWLGTHQQTEVESYW